MPGPLEGFRVIDFGQFLAGPLGPMMIGDLGADVIKVEPVRGDGMRGAVVGSFMGCQRGKRDIAIDLKQPEGLEIALKLIETADMVHHNMTKGTADRLGIGYEHCKAVNPDVIYCNNYMYGAEGPLSHLGGLDPLGQAACGIEWEQGPVHAGNRPLWYRYGHGDAAAAYPSASGCSSRSSIGSAPGKASRCGRHCSTDRCCIPRIPGSARTGLRRLGRCSTRNGSALERCIGSTKRRMDGCSWRRSKKRTGRPCAQYCADLS